LLGEWCGHLSGVYLYYPSRRQVPAPLRAFIDFVRGQLHVRSAASVEDRSTEPA
jgi:DNA-binding transcriptional LysR family regulator